MIYLIKLILSVLWKILFAILIIVLLQHLLGWVIYG
jgi:hypothetical protein